VSPVRRRALILAVPVLLAAAGGCSQAAGPTQEEYAAVADGLCQDTLKKVDDLYMDQAIETMKVSSGGESGIYTDRPETWVRAKIVPQYRNLSGGLKGIQPPDGDVTYLTDLYTDLDTLIEKLHRVPSEGREVIETDEQLRDRFESYGMKECPPVYDEAPDYKDPVKVMEAAAEADKPAE
jgi:hypothetical protein